MSFSRVPRGAWRQPARQSRGHPWGEGERGPRTRGGSLCCHVSACGALGRPVGVEGTGDLGEAELSASLGYKGHELTRQRTEQIQQGWGRIRKRQLCWGVWGRRRFGCLGAVGVFSKFLRHSSLPLSAGDTDEDPCGCPKPREVGNPGYTCFLHINTCDKVYQAP